MKLFHICKHCNKEYQIAINERSEHTFSNCEHCGERNDVWVRIEREMIDNDDLKISNKLFAPLWDKDEPPKDLELHEGFSFS